MTIPEHMELDPDAPARQAGRLRVKQGEGRCPECGEPLDNGRILAHRRTHYPDRWDPENPPSAEAENRFNQLTQMSKDAGESR